MKNKKRSYTPYAKLNEIGDYYHELSEEQRNWIKRFDHDMYNGGVYEEGTVLENEDAKKEARKLHNSLKRDAFDVSVRKGKLQYIDVNEEQYRNFMEHVSDEQEWELIYDRFGYKEAAKHIFKITEEQIKEGSIELKVVLSQYYVRMSKLKRMNKRDKAKEPK